CWTGGGSSLSTFGSIRSGGWLWWSDRRNRGVGNEGLVFWPGWQDGFAVVVYCALVLALVASVMVVVANAEDVSAGTSINPVR
ncbi:MAG: hypothetical protein WBF71_09995, partial [Microthrixaceae bacterium]